MIKNAIYRVDNGSDFDEIHFKTNPNQVVFDDGETFQQKLDSGTLKGEQVYVNVEGSHISTDSSVGYAKDIEILGNTIQDASNLADIRSVGDTVEGQELYEIPVVSVGKNLLKDSLIRDFTKYTFNETYKSIGIKVEKGKSYIASLKLIDSFSPNDIANTYFSISDYCNPASPTQPEYHHLINGIKYIPQTTPITSKDGYIYLCVFNQTGNTKDIFDKLMKNIEYIQLEEGTQATPYEPYVEDKLTILSPTPLEKVGDVADKIICKDGVWGVEKNVGTQILDGNESWGFSGTIGEFTVFGHNPGSSIRVYLCDKFKVYPNKDIAHEGVSEGLSQFQHADFYEWRVCISNSKLSSVDVTGFKTWLRNNPILVKYEAKSPTFIPLPHSQQVKLRTFANKTNISFLTEIEGTIKAQVPKSLGATVNTHTEQISNLNKELDRVKKLEENTVSTVTTESDFTTVEATSNGYFEDVKLEGKTLVNLAEQPTNNGAINTQYATISKVTNIKPSTEYTYIIRNNGSEMVKLYLNNNGGFVWTEFDVEVNSTVVGKAKSLPTISGDIWLSLNKAETVEQNLQVVLLEGDHTQNPPSYFEGLKSVGQDVDEISVESVDGDGNLLNSKYKEEYLTTTVTADMSNSEYVWLGKGEYCVSQMAKGFVGERYVYALYDEAGNRTMSSVVRTTQDEQLISAKLTISNSGLYKIVPSPHNGTSNTIWCKQFMINKGTTPKPYTPYQADKKRLLYYNEETQTWEKPILREWDSIEKHTNGKYYYHQRSAEVVLNGSERWIGDPASANMINMWVSCENIKAKTIMLCDKFNYEPAFSYGKDKECISNVTNNVINLALAKSRLVTQDAQGFKQWLQNNNVTVVYQLAQEKVYECTNIDLITYANETNFIIESGAIAPRTTLKVHSNISNVVSLLQKKVSLLESNVKASQEVQDMMILETDMRMLDIELALMEFIPMKLNLGGSDMLRSATYFNFLKNHIINETYEKEYLENVMNKYLATGRINQDEYNELYKMLYPPVYDIELPIEY